MTKKIIEYEIEPNGLCQYCKAKDVFYIDFGKNKIEYCKAFSEQLPAYRDSCQACKDFLTQEKILKQSKTKYYNPKIREAFTQIKTLLMENVSPDEIKVCIDLIVDENLIKEQQ
jgi:hypothetical protein